MKTILYILILKSISSALQINFHLTDSTCVNRIIPEHKHEISVSYDCLRIPIVRTDAIEPQQIITYCVTYCPSMFNEHFLNDQPQFTFHQLAQQHVTPQQLFLWSAPIDLIENYQLFLNHQSSADSVEVTNEIFYNCTWPRIGPRCQYAFDHLSSQNASQMPSSTVDLVYEYYYNHVYEPTELTCYTHLTCDRGSTSSCLDWSEICDGKIDCFDGEHDEDDCWRLELSECEEDEFRCGNGQCIPNTSVMDSTGFPSCLDASNQHTRFPSTSTFSKRAEPSFKREDVTCTIHNPMKQQYLTSSCMAQRSQLLMKTLFVNKPAYLSDDCWLAFQCAIHLSTIQEDQCKNFCGDNRCIDNVWLSCPHSLFILPSRPFLFGHLYFGYDKTRLNKSWHSSLPDFLCIDERFCDLSIHDNTSIKFNNLTCHRFRSLGIPLERSLFSVWFESFSSKEFSTMWRCSNVPNLSNNHCQQKHVYQCRNSSKCISFYRLLDKIEDCMYGDDEEQRHVENVMSLHNISYFFKCSSSNNYIAKRLYGNGICDCPYSKNNPCDDEHTEGHHIQTHPSFQTMCDGFTELLPVMIDGRSMTDETDCQQWLCDNIYTRCDGIWNCFDGSDEIDCGESSPLICLSDHRICVLADTNQMVCLHLDKVDDGHVDCLGATDEPRKCRIDQLESRVDHFYCRNDTRNPCIHSLHLCNG